MKGADVLLRKAEESPLCAVVKPLQINSNSIPPLNLPQIELPYVLSCVRLNGGEARAATRGIGNNSWQRGHPHDRSSATEARRVSQPRACTFRIPVQTELV